MQVTFPFMVARWKGVRPCEKSHQLRRGAYLAPVHVNSNTILRVGGAHTRSCTYLPVPRGGRTNAAGESTLEPGKVANGTCHQRVLSSHHAVHCGTRYAVCVCVRDI